MEFKEIVMKRYATKLFDGKRLPEEKIDELLDLIRLTPSGLNVQPWKVKVISDQKTKEELLQASFGQQQVTTCSHLLVFCANTDIAGQIEKVDSSMREGGVSDETRERMMGMVKNVMADAPLERRIEIAKCHAFLAIGNAVNGAKALGFDSCPMTGFDPEAYSRILNLPEHLVPTLLCPVGYAADNPIPKTRLKKEDIFF